METTKTSLARRTMVWTGVALGTLISLALGLYLLGSGVAGFMYFFQGPSGALPVHYKASYDGFYLSKQPGGSYDWIVVKGPAAFPLFEIDNGNGVCIPLSTEKLRDTLLANGARLPDVATGEDVVDGVDVSVTFENGKTSAVIASQPELASTAHLNGRPGWHLRYKGEIVALPMSNAEMRKQFGHPRLIDWK
jgi:hypothetical protein